jgi:3',5'-cyclic AMP phosphodiesterase CpdA
VERFQASLAGGLVSGELYYSARRGVDRGQRVKPGNDVEAEADDFSMSKPFLLAHLSDPHLGPLPRPAVRELASKRFVGYVNWQRGRRHVHRRDALDAVTHDLHGAKPDHVAVTGDLVNIALPAEFIHARRWLETLGQPADVSVVPGNHDAYVTGAGIHCDRHWLPYMSGDESSPEPRPAGGRVAGGPGGETAFPYVRRRGSVALVGVSTAVPTPPFMATGRLGDAQIAAVARTLDELRTGGAFRVVMIHHPPVPAARHKCLVDAVAFQRAIAAAGAELIIHGHDHVHSLVWIGGKGARVPVIGVPSASVSGHGKTHAAAYNLYLIDGGPGAWSCEVVSRGLRSSGAVAEVNRFPLSWT